MFQVVPKDRVGQIKPSELKIDVFGAAQRWPVTGASTRLAGYGKLGRMIRIMLRLTLAGNYPSQGFS